MDRASVPDAKDHHGEALVAVAKPQEVQQQQVGKVAEIWLPDKQASVTDSVRM